MQRTNTFEVRPLSEADRVLLLELLDASAACYNEVNYERRQALFEARDDADGRVPVSTLKRAVRGATTQEHYRQRYIQTLGSAAPQQLVQKNWAAWKSFFTLLRKYRDPADEAVTDRPSPPGYWKDGDTRRLQTVVRNDQYTLARGERSRLEIPVGMHLKEQYGLGYQERLRLEVRGRPHWTGTQGRLELVYDRATDTFTAQQTVSDDGQSLRRRDSSSPPLAPAERGESADAAVDIGANTLAAVTTEAGDYLLVHGRPCFQRFRDTTEEIARLQQTLPTDTWSSRRIRELYHTRDSRRNHAQDALVRELGAWLSERGIATLFVGALDDVREAHWSAAVNEKTDLFWAHGRFRRRLREVLEAEYGITVREASEAGTSSKCPACRSDTVTRNGDLLQCHACGAEVHSDLAGAVNFLTKQAGSAPQLDTTRRPMARPVASRENTTEDGHQRVPYLEWDDHAWRHAGHPETKQASTNRSTREGKLASGGAGPA